MTMENPPFEDLFPIAIGDFPISQSCMLVFRAVSRGKKPLHVDHCKALPATRAGVFTDITIKEARCNP